MRPVTSITLAMFCRWRMVMKSSSSKSLRSGIERRHHHREAREDGAGDEVGREDGGVPAGHDADREVEAHDGVDREHERRREPGEQQVRRLVVVPVRGRAAPAHGAEAVDDLGELALRAVAQRREVGDEADVPEEQRDRGVGRDREDVPDERAAELRPHPHRARVRHEPVEEPRPPEVQNRVLRRAGDREDRHRLGEAVDRRAPLLPEEEQDGGDQRAGVADADPPHEVDDVPAPGDRDVDAPDADALEEEPADRDEEQVEQRERDARRPGYHHFGVLREDDRADLVGERRRRVARREMGRRDARRVGATASRRALRSTGSTAHVSSSSGFGFVMLARGTSCAAGC